MAVVNTFVAGNTITAAGHNQNDVDIAAEITNSLALDGQSTMTGQVKGASGTVSAPSFTFGSDLDTGFYRRAANTVGVTLGGVDYIDFSSVSVSIGQSLSVGTIRTNNGMIFSAGSLLAADGSSASPAISFSGDSDVGFYRRTANAINLVLGDKDTIEFSTASASIGQSIAVGALRSLGAVSGTTITGTGAVTGATAAGAMIATQAEQETGTAVDKLVTPGRQHFHVSAAKGWIMVGNTGNIEVSYNVTGVSDVGTGTVEVTWATDFSAATYPVAATPKADGATATHVLHTTFAAGVTRTTTRNILDGAAIDPNHTFIIAFGDQA